jgi:hypothetical protein
MVKNDVLPSAFHIKTLFPEDTIYISGILIFFGNYYFKKVNTVNDIHILHHLILPYAQCSI